jgi:hypothetical protein
MSQIIDELIVKRLIIMTPNGTQYLVTVTDKGVWSKKKIKNT